MKNRKRLKKVMYAAMPVLWCAALYIGSDSSLGTVLAKSVTSATQTLTAYPTAVMTETLMDCSTEIMTATEVQGIGVTQTATQTGNTVPTVTEYSTVTQTGYVRTKFDTVTTQTQTWVNDDAHDDDGYWMPTETVTLVPVEVPVQEVTGTLTVGATEVPTVTGTTTEVPCSVMSAGETLISTQTAVFTQAQTMTEMMTMTVTQTMTDGGKNDDGIIEQVTPTVTPTATPTITPMTAQAETPTVAPVYDGDSEEPQGWRPQTADEKERASYVQKGKVKLHKPSSVTIEPAMQGPLCIAAMKNAMMKGGQIGYTYNIKYIADENAKQPVYEIDKPIQITFSVPKDILKEGRTYEMICVSKDGTTYTCPATVDEDGNLTFTTKYFYAYALTYKDA